MKKFLEQNKEIFEANLKGKKYKFLGLFNNKATKKDKFLV